MRLIDADALHENITNGDGTSLQKFFADCCVAAAPTINPYKWISVEDRLPNPHDTEPDWSETVLFRTTQGHIYSGYRYKGLPQTSFYDDDWSPPYWLDESENLNFEDDEVTHWMLLPVLPTEKEC